MNIEMVDIVYCRLDHLTGKNSIQKGDRPCIIISNDACNKFSPILTGIVGTSEIDKCKLPTHFILSPSCGLKQHTLFMAEQIVPIPRQNILFKAGRVPDHLIHIVDRAVDIQLGRLEPFDITKVRKLIAEIEFIDNLFKKYRIETEEELLFKESCLKQLQVYCSRYDYDYTKLLRNDGIADYRGVAMCG